MDLPIVARLFFLLLSLISIYTLFTAIVIMMRLLSLTNQRQAEDASSVQRSVVALQTRSANVQQLIGATFYLFGLIFFLSLPLATRILGDSHNTSWDSNIG